MKNLVSSQMRRPNTNTLKIMNKKEVKQLTKGCTVLVKATVESVQETKAYVHHGCITHPLPFNEIYSVPTQPKYDPCREFQPGDKVRMVMRDDRYPYCYKMREHIVPTDTICTITKRENCGFVEVEYNNGYNPIVHFSFLELVTPVEELEPFYIIDDDADAEHPFFVIQNRKSTLSSGLDEEVMRFLYGQNYTADKDTVRKRAEAERDRLNAEWRKEQK